LRRCYDGLLALRGRLRRPALALGNGAVSRQPCVRVAVEGGEFQSCFLLGKLRLGLRELRLRLMDATLRIHSRLAGLQFGLSQLILENRYLLADGMQPGSGIVQRGLRLILPRARLRVVEYCYGVAGLHRIAFAKTDFEDTASHLGRNRRIVAFNAAAERNHVGGLGRFGKEYFPDRERGAAHDQQSDDYPRQDARFLCRLITHWDVLLLRRAVCLETARREHSEKSAM
jgi:hypothetical protein